VGAYRLTFEKPATRLEAAVLSLGHPPKARDRQDERHGYGSTAWLDEVDGVGFRMEAAKVPIRRGHRGGSRLYAVKDRDDQVKQHGHQVANRDGWSYMGQFVMDDTVKALSQGQLLARTQAQLLAPEADDAAQALDSIGKLAQAIVEYLEGHGHRFESRETLKAGLRAARVAYNDHDLPAALLRLQDENRLEWPETGRGKGRPGWLKITATRVDDDEKK
jgi:hypothetical protein